MYNRVTKLFSLAKFETKDLSLTDTRPWVFALYIVLAFLKVIQVGQV